MAKKSKIFFLGALVLCSFINVKAKHQDSLNNTQKGNWLVGGVLNGSTGFSKDYYYLLGLNPNAGIFIKKNLAIGLKSQFTGYSDKSNKNFTVGAGPFIRYYIPAERSLRAFITADASYNYYYTAYSFFPPDVITKSNRIIAGISPGLSYFFNKHVGIEAMLRYEVSVDKNYISTVSQDNARLYLLAGFQAYLGRK